MEEVKQDVTKNVKMLGQILKEEKLKDLLDKIKKSQSKASAIVKTLNDKENELRKKAQAEIAGEAIACENSSNQPEKADQVPEKTQEKAEVKAKSTKKAKEEKAKEVEATVEVVAVEEKPSAKAPKDKKAEEVKVEEKIEQPKAQEPVKEEVKQKPVEAVKAEEVKVEAIKAEICPYLQSHPIVHCALCIVHWHTLQKAQP